jgi:hypothetical protein
MTPQERQQALDNISAEELARIKAHQASTQGAYPVDNEWLLLAEFGKAYGWDAYLHAREDKITGAEMLTLVEASRKLDYIKQFRMAEAVLAGAATAFTGKSQTFKALTQEIIKKTKVKE